MHVFYVIIGHSRWLQPIINELNCCNELLKINFYKQITTNNIHEFYHYALYPEVDIAISAEANLCQLDGRKFLDTIIIFEKVHCI